MKPSVFIIVRRKNILIISNLNTYTAYIKNIIFLIFFQIKPPII